MAERGVVYAVGALVEALSVQLVDLYLELLCRGERELSRAVLKVVSRFGLNGARLAQPQGCRCGPLSCSERARLQSAARDLLALALVADSAGCRSVSNRCERLLSDGRMLLRLLSGPERPQAGTRCRPSPHPDAPGECACEQSACGEACGGKDSFAGATQAGPSGR